MRTSETTTSRPEAEIFAGSDLGPATVLEAGAGEVRVRLQAGHEVQAQLALAFLYQPVPGDVLLVVSHKGAHYGIGVLHAQGTPGVAVAGDLALHAVGGKLKLIGDEGIVLQTSGEASVQAKSLRTVAGRVVERLESVTRWVSGQISLRAGGVTRQIEGTEITQSKNSVHTAEESIKIDSHQVHLGH